MNTHIHPGLRRGLLAAAIRFVVLAPLYGACAALASEPAPAAAANATPHIALLLPTQSKIFGRHASAVRDGVLAAAKAAGKSALPLREYALTGEVADALRTYRAAAAAGARLVIGPLTRDAVTAIAFGEPVNVPTLALNLPDQTGRSPERFYMLSLQVETEGRQVAQLAWRESRRRALVVSNGSALQRRLQAAFTAEFTRLGGSVIGETATPDPQRLRAALRAEPDMALLALDFDEARLARPHLGNLPAYAGASANDGERSPLAAFDLAGVAFVDMPWLLEPDHPAVMTYPRPATTTPELERLYALGIDAWRVAQMLLDAPRELRLDGVSGELRLTTQGLIERRLRAARYHDGRLRLIDIPGDEPLR